MIVCFLDNAGHLLLVEFSSLDFSYERISRLHFHIYDTFIVLKNPLRHGVGNVIKFELLR